MLKLILLSLLTLAPNVSASINYIEAFEQVRSQSFWPVPKSPNGDYIISTFGPRTKGGTGAYDFHRGVDIRGDIGDDIVAAFDGTVHRIFTDSGGGFTIILEHVLPQAAKLLDDKEETTKFFTVYMHGDSSNLGEGIPMSAGDVIATIGDSGGTALTPHLHFEVRIGTR